MKNPIYKSSDKSQRILIKLRSINIVQFYTLFIKRFHSEEKNKFPWIFGINEEKKFYNSSIKQNSRNPRSNFRIKRLRKMLNVTS